MPTELQQAVTQQALSWLSLIGRKLQSDESLTSNQHPRGQLLDREQGQPSGVPGWWVQSLIVESYCIVAVEIVPPAVVPVSIHTNYISYISQLLTECVAAAEQSRGMSDTLSLSRPPFALSQLVFFGPQVVGKAVSSPGTGGRFS